MFETPHAAAFVSRNNSAVLPDASDDVHAPVEVGIAEVDGSALFGRDGTSL